MTYIEQNEKMCHYYFLPQNYWITDRLVPFSLVTSRALHHIAPIFNAVFGKDIEENFNSEIVQNF